MDWIRQWLTGVTAAAMLAAAAKSLLPGGAAGKIAGLTGGLVLLLAVLRPVGGLDEGRLEAAFAPYRGAWTDYEAALPETGGDSWMQAVIEESCGEYIEGKAGQEGILCRADVTCGETGKPERIVLRGSWTRGQQAWLEEMIERDLAVPRQAQSYQLEGGETQ